MKMTILEIIGIQQGLSSLADESMDISTLMNISDVLEKCQKKVEAFREVFTKKKDIDPKDLKKDEIDKLNEEFLKEAEKTTVNLNLDIDVLKLPDMNYKTFMLLKPLIKGAKK